MKGAGYKAATSSTFHHLDNHFLSSVHRQAVSVDQESNTGTLPLSLVSIFCSIINRLDPAFNIRARPVGFPGIVLAAVANRTDVVGEEQWHFINLFVSGDILSPSELRSFAALAGLERSMDVEVFRPASARDMVSPSPRPYGSELTMLSRIKCIRAARNIIQSVRTEDSANPTPALYAAAMALFILSPPSPVTAYANWIVGICQADYESDVGVIERDVLPALPPAERTNMGLITQVIRDVDDTVPTLKEGLDLKWKPGHVFRHRLFSYVAVIRAWDMTCEASENCKFPSGSEMESSPRVNSSGFG
jgi:F-box protein 21